MNCLQCGTEIPTERWQRHFCGCCVLDRSRNSGRALAAIEVRKAIKAGRLRPAAEFACSDCGEQATAYEHRDYSKPLDVDAVCGSCNMRRGPGKWTKFKPLREIVQGQQAGQRAA